ncbi:methyl-accepting chemotaxis protein [Oxalobacteraceae bacterium A2-2]
MLSKLKIGPKLLLAPALALLLLATLSGGAYLALVRQNQSLDVIVQQRTARVREAGELAAAAHRSHSEVYQLLTWISGSFSPARIDGLVADLHARQAALDRMFVQLELLVQASPAERRYVAQSQAAYAEYTRAVADAVEISMLDQSIAANAMSKAERAFDVVARRLAELAELERSLSERAYAEAESEFQLCSRVLPLVVVLSICLSLLVTMVVRRSLLRELDGIGAAALGLASGNLTVQARDYGSDEIAATSRALDESIRNLNGTLKHIFASAASLNEASRELVEDNAHLGSQVGAQASALEQASSSMRELSETVAQAADQARLADELARCASGFAARGGSVVEQLTVTMDSIRGSSRKVGDVVGVIDAIAFQTNLLALNAAVEAARAGEQGRGFAVVAGEVRQLAQRSAMAAQEIKALMAASVAEIDGGSRSVREAGSSMAQMAASVRQVGELVGQMGSASAQQAQGLQGMQQAIVDMDQVTQQNMALVEQAADAASGLQQQALSLSQAVSAFKLGQAIDAANTPALQAPSKDGGPRLHLAHVRK